MRRDRDRREELQVAYEQGFQQMYDHDSASLCDGMELMVESVAPGSLPGEAMAAAYMGGADALRALATMAREAAKVERALRTAGLGRWS